MGRKEESQNKLFIYNDFVASNHILRKFEMILYLFFLPQGPMRQQTQLPPRTISVSYSNSALQVLTIF